jgi:hypothetical protein
MGQFEKSRIVLMNEFRTIIKQTEDSKKIHKQYEVALAKAHDRLEHQEVKITELNQYIKWMHEYLGQMDRDLGVWNGGDAVLGGPVVDGLEKFQSMMQDPSSLGDKKKDRLFNLTNNFFEKPLQFYSSFLTLAR